jgi:2-polyprenyl-3-methyl-5-hydroxy-6-metoxy-1,4-benzoquinol methylase
VPFQSRAAHSNDSAIELSYEPLEQLVVPAPVQRLDWIVDRCTGMRVLDLGCYDDETAFTKLSAQHWLHERICLVAAYVLGVDSSEKVPVEGLRMGPNAQIIRTDVNELAEIKAALTEDLDVIVAGGLFEHMANTLDFLRQLKRSFPGKQLIASTPNASSLTNSLLALTGRENSHKNHLQVYSYKTLATLCRNANIQSFRIVPYHQHYSDGFLRSDGHWRLGVQMAEVTVKLAESLFPLLSGGLILHVPSL